MAAIHRLKIDSDILRTNAASPVLLEELFRTGDKSVSYELSVGSGVTATSLPGFGTGAAVINTIQTFLLITDTNVTLNWNGANTGLVVGSGQRRGVFAAYGVSTTTVPTISNSGSTTATVQVMASGI